MITILYFASLREKIGKANEEISGIIHLVDLQKYLNTTYPNCFDESIITAVNMKVITGNTTLNDGDEVAFYPPVTGG